MEGDGEKEEEGAGEWKRELQLQCWTFLETCIAAAYIADDAQ